MAGAGEGGFETRPYGWPKGYGGYAWNHYGLGEAAKEYETG